MIVILSLKELSTPAKSNIRKESLDCCSLMGLDGKAIETVLWFISTFYVCKIPRKRIKLRSATPCFDFCTFFLRISIWPLFEWLVDRCESILVQIGKEHKILGARRILARVVEQMSIGPNIKSYHWTLPPRRLSSYFGWIWHEHLLDI